MRDVVRLGRSNIRFVSGIQILPTYFYAHLLLVCIEIGEPLSTNDVSRRTRIAFMAFCFHNFCRSFLLICDLQC